MLNIKSCNYFLFLSIFLAGIFSQGCQAVPSSVIVSKIKNKNYYHLSYKLSAENILSIESLTKDQFLINGGQFELVISKDLFPIASPNCAKNIILRMPWTNDNYKNSDTFISEKYELYNELKNASKTKDEINVYIELNPYVEVSNDKFVLTQCNVFFRHADGRYIPKIGKL